MTTSELFDVAVNAYKDWWMCGRDFANHTEIFEAWDDAINAYATASKVSRDHAINQVRAVLGMSNTL